MDAYYLESMADHTLLTPSQERRLLRRAQMDDFKTAIKAKDQLIRKNQRLVIKLALRYKGKGVAMDDLISEGNIALLKAIEKFDLGRDLRFSTYAVWWIHNRLQRAVMNQGKVIRIPIHAHERATKARRVQSDLTQRLGREATSGEVVEATGYEKWFVEFALSPDFVISLDQDRLIVHDFGEPLVERVKDEEPLPHEMVQNHEGFDLIMAALRELPARQREILWRTLMDGETKTQAGSRVDIGRETARRQHDKACCKLADLLLETNCPATRNHLESMGFCDSYVLRVQWAYNEQPGEEVQEKTIAYFSAKSEASIREKAKEAACAQESARGATKRVYVLRKFPSGELVKRMVFDSRGWLVAA